MSENSTIPDKNSYFELSKKYSDFANNLKLSLSALLSQASIDFHDIQTRIKSYDSFVEKISRKNYRSPYEIEDICGIRIICYYTDDLNRVKRIIEDEFNVLNSTNKVEESQPDQFWYRSEHFVISLKDSWLTIPNYRGLKGVRAEIQVRTILMHAWADIEWKLSYKKLVDAPLALKRPLAQLSALLDLADERFNNLRKEKESYVKKVTSTMLRNNNLNISEQLDIDTLQIFFSKYLTRYKKPSISDLAKLLDELRESETTLRNIYEGYNKTQERLDEVVNDLSKIISRDINAMTQTGIARLSLDLTNDNFYSFRSVKFPDKLKEVLNKWRGVFKMK